MKHIVYSDKAPAPIGPYSQAVKVNGILYVSGQIGLDNKGNLINESLEQETDQVMKNLGNILKAGGSTYEQVIKCTIFINDMNHFSRINAVYGKYFEKNPPARETVEVSALPKFVNIEISCMAICD